MLSVSEFQEALDRLATDVGEETQSLYDENFGMQWRDEEGTTGGLLGGVALSAKQHAKRLHQQGIDGIALRAAITQKHREKEHGGDALIRFTCREEQWSISTTTIIQSKRHDRGRPFDTADHQRLSRQLAAMMRYTPEGFVMLYSKSEGIRLVPALAAASTGTRDLFNIPTLAWPRFLRGIFLGHFGEPIPARVPEPSEEWKPMWVLEIVAEMTRYTPATLGVARA